MVLSKKLYTFAANLKGVPSKMGAEIIPKEPGQVMLPRDSVIRRNVCTPENAKYTGGQFQEFFYLILT